MRLFASVPNGKKGGRNNGTVNKNNSKAKKLAQGGDEPPLTIYPFSINDLQKPQTKAKPTNKPDTKSFNNKTDAAPILSCKIESKPVLACKIETKPILTQTTDTKTILKTMPVSVIKTEPTSVLQSCKIPERNSSVALNKNSTDKTELDAEKRIQAIVTHKKYFNFFEIIFMFFNTFVISSI